MVKLSPNESKLIEGVGSIKGYKSMSEDELLSALISSKPVRKGEKNFDDKIPKTNFYKTRIEKIRKEFKESRHEFFRSKTNNIRRNLYEIENAKNLSASKIKEIERSLTELEENLSKGIRDVKDLFHLSIDENYCKPIITNDAFNNNYIQYESTGDKDKTLTPSEYLDMIRPYLSDIINDHKTQGEWRIHSGNTIMKPKTQSEWKIQLTMSIIFISSKDSDETRTMYAKTNSIESMMDSETDEIIKELYKSFLQRYQEKLEESMRGSCFIFDSIDAFYYDLNKVSLSRGRSYKDSAEWLKDKKATINPKNNDGKCFQYPLTVAFNHEQIKSHPEKV